MTDTILGKGHKDGFLKEDDTRDIIAQAFEKWDVSGKRVLAIIPDSTRTAPIPFFFRTLYETIGERVSCLHYMIALGTHPPMTEETIADLIGVTREERMRRYPKVEIFNHAWNDPKALRKIGVITEKEVEEISGGLMRENVTVEVNRRLYDYDQIVIVGPTFPHEVVGFSGGIKYFFPGVAGAEILNFFHWLGAVITNPVINGAKRTPVRDVVDRAAAMIDLPKLCFSLVVTHDGLKGLYVDTPENAYSAAADLSARVHIIYVDKPFDRVLSMAPKMYDDIWTAGKCMYKLEPVIADGGELIIYAPHVDEISYTHGRILDQIGYHVRDYFVKQMDKFRDIPRGVMAHSTHVKGIGTYENGIEKPRVNVTLATAIPEERCRRVNLGYRDMATIHPEEWKGREDDGVLCVPNAGEMLHHLKHNG